MATTPPVVTTPTKPPEKNWEAMKQKLIDVKSKIMEYLGKPGYNPYITLNKLGIPELEREVSKGLLSDGLYERIAALEFKVPKVEGVVVGQKTVI